MWQTVARTYFDQLVDSAFTLVNLVSNIWQIFVRSYCYIFISVFQSYPVLYFRIHGKFSLFFTHQRGFPFSGNICSHTYINRCAGHYITGSLRDVYDTVEVKNYHIRKIRFWWREMQRGRERANEEKHITSATIYTQ